MGLEKGLAGWIGHHDDRPFYHEGDPETLFELRYSDKHHSSSARTGTSAKRSRTPDTTSTSTTPVAPHRAVGNFQYTPRNIPQMQEQAGRMIRKLFEASSAGVNTTAFTSNIFKVPAGITADASGMWGLFGLMANLDAIDLDTFLW